MALQILYQGVTHWLASNEVTVGRSRSAGLVVATSIASRRHCCLRRDGDNLFVRDLGSTNGTLVNGRRIQSERKLGSGDVIRIGDAELEVVDAKMSELAPESRKLVGMKPRATWDDPTDPTQEFTPGRSQLEPDAVTLTDNRSPTR